MERLQKVIALSGICSRREAEKLIIERRVKVNNEVVTTLGTKVNRDDKIEVDGKKIKIKKFEYYLLNKPRGYVTTTHDEKDRNKVVDLIKTNARIYPIGRLDYNTTGLLLLTNDGEFKNILEHPSNNIIKTYLVKINTILDKNTLFKIKNGVKLDNHLIVPKKINVKKIDKDKNTSIIEISITEGINHEIKRIFETFNIDVLKLKRTKQYIFNLGKLNSGEYRKLTQDEVNKVYEIKKISNR